MTIIPDEELKGFSQMNLAPMVDFLFLIIAVFATLAITKTAIFDSEIQLVKVESSSEQAAPSGHNDYYIVNLSLNSEGEYKWITEFNEYLMSGVKGIQAELKRQQDLGLLSKETSQTKILFHIDKAAKWQEISDAIFAVRQLGFEIHPVYDYDESFISQ